MANALDFDRPLPFPRIYIIAGLAIASWAPVALGWAIASVM